MNYAVLIRAPQNIFSSLHRIREHTEKELKREILRKKLGDVELGLLDIFARCVCVYVGK